MMGAGQTVDVSTDSRLIEAGVRSALETLGQLLSRESLVLKGQNFIHSSAAAHTCLQQLRGDGVEVALNLSGRICGTFILALDNRAAQQLVTALVGETATTPAFNEMACSALKEAGNVVASAFLSALEALGGSGGRPGLPSLNISVPRYQECSVRADSSLMYALPVTLVAGTKKRFAARVGLFISLHGQHIDVPFSTS